jgi:phenylalanyl-tRNA synthetase alpha chain
MLKKEGKEEIRMICPGKTYRRENIDMTHEQEFNQIEGLVIGKDISLSDLKGTFDALVKKLFGNDVEARFRPSYYPFTEPSVEMDMSCFSCHGKGCSLCKPKGWITICGGGMVHPNVLKNCGYDPEKWQGFAFGLAAERVAMLKYNINDIRVFHENDLRETRTFDRKDGE